MVRSTRSDAVQPSAARRQPSRPTQATSVRTHLYRPQIANAAQREVVGCPHPLSHAKRRTLSHPWWRSASGCGLLRCKSAERAAALQRTFTRDAPLGHTVHTAAGGPSELERARERQAARGVLAARLAAARHVGRTHAHAAERRAGGARTAAGGGGRCTLPARAPVRTIQQVLSQRAASKQRRFQSPHTKQRACVHPVHP